MKIRYLLLPAGILFVFANPVVGVETPTDLVVDVYAKQPKEPKISGYGRPAKQIAQGTAHIKGKDAAKTGGNRLEDFATYVPGVQAGNTTGATSAITVRGFRAYQADLDGLPDVQGFYLRDPATLESVDIVKGRDSTLSGFGAPGGTFGYTSKKPSLIPKRTFSLLMGAPSQVRGLLDITGALRGNEWAGRLLVSGQQAETDYANVGDDRFSILPSLRWNGDDQTVSLSLEHGWQNREPNTNTIFHNGAPLYNLSYVDPRSSAERRMTRIAVDYSRQLNEQWEASLQASHIKAEQKETRIGISIPSNTPNEWYDAISKTQVDNNQSALRAELSHQRQSGKLEQQTRVGFFAQQMEGTFQSASGLGWTTLNVYQPLFGYTLPDDSLLRKTTISNTWPERAWYLQHHAVMNDKLGITGGIRASHTTVDAQIPGFSARSLDTRDTSTSLGVLWQTTPHWQWFVSHTESFSPNTGWDRNSNLFEPAQGVQHETGWRYARDTTMGKPVKVNLSAYRIKQKNVLTPDPLDSNYSVLTGTQQSEGIEASLDQPLSPQVDLSVGYSYTDARITSDNAGLMGKQLASVPRHSSALQLRYTPDAKTALNLGVVHVGKRPGNNSNSFEIDGYTRLDAAAQWKLDKRTTLRAGVQNLLDEDYIAASADINALVQGNKRTLTLGLEVDF